MKSRHELFLIYKEALQNITQHSGATVILIQLDLVKSNLSLKINDNGSGYDQYIVAEGAGIKAMKNRAAVLNADFDIQSDKKGTSVLLHVPI
jgi:signal transduction histidine kinase